MTNYCQIDRLKRFLSAPSTSVTLFLSENSSPIINNKECNLTWLVNQNHVLKFGGSENRLVSYKKKIHLFHDWILFIKKITLSFWVSLVLHKPSTLSREMGPCGTQIKTVVHRHAYVVPEQKMPSRGHLSWHEEGQQHARFLKHTAGSEQDRFSAVVIIIYANCGGFISLCRGRARMCFKQR